MLVQLEKDLMKVLELTFGALIIGIQMMVLAIITVLVF